MFNPCGVIASPQHIEHGNCYGGPMIRARLITLSMAAAMLNAITTDMSIIAIPNLSAPANTTDAWSKINLLQFSGCGGSG
eukprot:4720163-Amphidinium_carterae.1